MDLSSECCGYGRNNKSCKDCENGVPFPVSKLWVSSCVHNSFECECQSPEYEAHNLNILLDNIGIVHSIFANGNSKRIR